MRKKLRYLYAIFEDFTRAFPSMNHSVLWHKLHNLGVSSKFIRIMKNLYGMVNTRVKVDDQCSNKIQITEDVLQGETLSPQSFNLFTSDMEECFIAKGLEGIRIFESENVIIIMYADDVVIVAATKIAAY